MRELSDPAGCDVNFRVARNNVRGPTLTPVRLGSISRAHILSTWGSLEKSLAFSGTSSGNEISERNRPVPAATSAHGEARDLVQID